MDRFPTRDLQVSVKRKLAAILSADAAGYSRLMADDESATVDTLNAARDVFRQLIQRHAGRLIDTAGDSVLAGFPSVVEALQCASEVQEALHKPNETIPDHRRMYFRIGTCSQVPVHQPSVTITRIHGRWASGRRIRRRRRLTCSTS